MSGYQFLLEVLCEEIPANALPPARARLAAGLGEELTAQNLPFSEVRAYSTVRRLVVHVSGLPVRQNDRKDTVTGPPVKAAYAADGSPTQAALGFARGQGVGVDALRVFDGPKGQTVGVTKLVKGRRTPEVLGEIVPRVIAGLHFPKTMRWGGGEHVFVRPVHGVVALFGGRELAEVVPFELFGVSSGSRTVGHRVIAPGEIELSGVHGLDEYLSRMREAGVVIDPEERKATLEAEAARLAAEVNCTVRRDEALVGEHVELVEHAGVVRGTIARRYLELPEEIVVTTLRHHQKCLVLENEGKVAPFLLAVCDRADDPAGHVARGNEWVAGARLADAEFFFAKDRKKNLAEHAAGLERVVFHQKAGTFAEKTQSVAELGQTLMKWQLGKAWAPVERATKLLKADLVTAMVGEFPELQGKVGGIYACLEGEPDEVWQAIYDQYTPAGLEGPVPRGVAGALVGLADRLDTLAALFAAGELPTGSKDPFALRRAALAVVKVCAEAPLEGVSLADASQAALGRRRCSRQEVIEALREFLQERERFYMVTVAGVTAEVADAVLAARWGVVTEDVARACALEKVRTESVFADLAVAFKRVRNIVAKAEAGPENAHLLKDEAETALVAAVDAAKAELDARLGASDHLGALRALAPVAVPLDRFFTDVMVLCDDAALRAARLALLRKVESLFLTIADLSRLPTQAS